MENALVSLNEAAQQIGVTRETIKNWGNRGILALTTVGKFTYVTQESLDGIKASAPKLVKQMQAVEALQDELEIRKNSCMEDIREYRLEKILRKDSAQRVILYMEIFASLIDLIYDGRYDEREYKIMMMFLKGTPIDDIAGKFECSKQLVVDNIRKCNEVLFNLQPYVRLQEENKERGRKLELLEKDRKILLTMVEVGRKDETGMVRKMGKEQLELYLTPVKSLDFSTRTSNILASNDMDCLGDLVHYGRDMRMFRGMGDHSLREIEEMLANRFHLTMGMRIPGWESICRAFFGKNDEGIIYEKLFEMDDEAKEYMEMVLEELPEERAGRIRGLFQGLYSAGEACKKELEQYKQACDNLREEIKKQEKRLANRDFYLSPVYKEAKELFMRLEAKGARQPREVNSEGVVEPAVDAMGLLDCIFSQEAVQAESRRMQEDWVKIVKLETDLRRLKTKMEQKDKHRERYNARRREMDREREEQLAEEREVVTAREAALESEIERWKKMDEKKTQEWTRERELSRAREMSLERELYLLRQKEEVRTVLQENSKENDKIALLKKELEWSKKVNAETSKHYALEVERSKRQAEVLELELKHTKELLESREKDIAERKAFLAEKEMRLEEKEQEVLRMAQQDYGSLWNTLSRYEKQVDAFNSQPWYRKLWQKMERFSDAKKRLLKLKF